MRRPFDRSLRRRLVHAPRPLAQLATALLVATCVSLLPVFLGEGESAEAAPADTRVELLERRTERSKTFRNPDGTLTTSVFAGPVHFREAAGRWADIRSRLVEADLPGFALQNEANGFRVLFKPRLGDGFLRLEVDGDPYSFALEGPSPAAGLALGSQLAYPDAFPGVDLRYELLAEGVKETLILANRDVPTRYRFLLTPPAGAELRAEPASDGSWTFLLGEETRAAFTLAPPRAVETTAEGEPVLEGRPHAHLQVTPVGDRFAIDLSVDEAWLRAPERRFPVLLDPTVVVQPSAEDASFDQSCPTCAGVVDDRLSIGTTDTRAWRAGVRFDLADLPAGADVTEAKLFLYHSRTCLAGGGGGTPCGGQMQQVDVHRMTASWSSASQTQQIAFDPTVLGSYTVGVNAELQWMDWDVTQTVENWLAGTQPNHGFLLKRATEPLGASGPRPPAASYAKEASLRPRLDVTYLGDAVDLAAPTTLHSNGAELAWSRYAGQAPFQQYEVHRSPTAGFTPTSGTLLATLTDIDTTTYTDTSAIPGNAYTYKVVANTSASNGRTVTLPADGLATTVIQLAPETGKAAYIASNSGSEACKNYGARDRLEVGSDSNSADRPLLQFDLASIPDGAAISEATLSLFHPYGINFESTVHAYALTSPWAEGTGNASCSGDGATWTQADATSEWETPGGDFDPTPLASIASGEFASVSWHNYNLTSLVQEWLTGETPNHGVLLKMDDETLEKDFSYAADDWTIAPTVRPKLTITYLDGSHTPYADVVKSDGPRAYWRLGEPAGSTSAADASGNGYTGTYRGTGTSPGVPGALAGDSDTAVHIPGGGAEGYDVYVPDDPGLDFGTSDFTVEAWVKTTKNQERVIAAKSTNSAPDWRITVTDDAGHVGEVRAKLRDGTSSRTHYGPALRIDDGNWHHVVVVFDRDYGTKFYVDGLEKTKTGTAPNSVSNSAPLRIGDTASDDPLDGDIDEFALYPSALTPERIRAHYFAYRQPLLDSPNEAADVETAEPVLRVHGLSPDGVGGALDYAFQVATDANFPNVVDASGWLPGTNTYTVQPGLLDDGSDYYWRARARSQGQVSAWSSARMLRVRLPKLGIRDVWPMWSHGPFAVNLANGNLVLSVSGPSYPTGLGFMGTSVIHNSKETTDRGLGVGWTLVAGDELSAPPAHLIDHSVLTGGQELDAVEVVFPDGGSFYYSHVGDSNVYLAEAGDGAELRKNANGTWALLDVDGALYTFGIADAVTGVATLTSAELTSAEPGEGKLTYAFSAQDPTKITAITDAAGRALTFTWNSLNPTECANAILCVSGPDAVVWRYIGNAGGGTSGRLARVNNGTRDIVALTYDAQSRIQKLQNANDLDPTAASPGYNGDHAINIAYDTSGRVASLSEGPISTQTPSTSTWTFAYTPGAVTTPRTARAADGYTSVTPPRQQGEPNPTAEKSYYDNLGRMMEAVDILGSVTAVAYNERDQLIWEEDEEGKRTDYEWDRERDVLLALTGSDPDGPGSLGRPVTRYRYDETTIGTASAPGPPLTGLQASYYSNANLAGRPTKRQNDATVDFSWGTGGPAALPGLSDNFSIRWEGNLSIPVAGDYTFTTRSDEGMRLTVGGIDAIDNWVDQTATTISSEPVTLSAGLHEIRLDYYEKTGPAEIELRWACTSCTPSIAEQVIPSSALQPRWLNRTSAVSPAGRVAFRHIADPAADRSDYDLVRLADGTNLITSYSHDSAGRVTQKVTPKGNAGRTIDSAGNLQGSPDLTYATEWTYYSLTETAAPPAACGGGTAVAQAGLPKSQTPHGVATTTTVYDTAGRAIAETNGAGTTCSTFDAEGQLTSEKAPGEPQATTYTYDPVGNRRTAQDASGIVTSEYDEAGREKRSIDSFGAEATFAYDPEGNLLNRTVATGPLASNPNYTTVYSYDDAGQPASITDPAGRQYAFTYDSRGNLRTIQYPNDTFTWHDYNAAGWLTALYNRHGTLPTPLPASVPADSQASPLADYGYAYDIEGRKTEETRTGGGLTTEASTYTYDPFGRMDTVTLPDGTLRRYRFDLDSNRTQVEETPPGGSMQIVATYTYDPGQTPGVDQLTSVTENGQTKTFTYTSDGQVNGRGQDTITWDGWGRMTGGIFAGSTVSYGFDPLGFRRSRTAGGQTTRYVHGGLFETDGGGSITLSDIDGPAGDLAHYAGAPTSSNGVSYLYYNGRGDVAAEADGSGLRTAAFAYDPFGTLRSGSAPANATSERFTARWDKKLDQSSGLVEMGVRPYDPDLGRFYAIDPVDGGSLNAYDYALQDPINAYDLDGRIVFIPVAIVSARIVSLAAPVVARAVIRRFGARVRYTRSAQQQDLYHRIPHRVVKKVLRGGRRTNRSDGSIAFTGKAKFGGRRGRMEIIGRYQRNPDTGRPEFRVFHRFFNPNPRPNLPE